MKKNLILTLFAFLTVAVLETVINQMLLKDIYGSLAPIWRPTAELTAYAPIFFGIYLVFSISYAYLFQMAYKGEGFVSGIWIGLAIGGIAKFWYGYTNLIVLPIPHTLGFLWFFYGTIETMILGALSAMVLDRLQSKQNTMK